MFARDPRLVRADANALPERRYKILRKRRSLRVEPPGSETRNERRSASHCHQGAVERLKAKFRIWGLR